MASAVVERLVAPDFLSALQEVVHDMLCVLSAQAQTATELGLDHLDSREQADLIVSGIAALLDPAKAPAVPDAALAAEVAAISYRDWTFSLVLLPDGRRAVKMVAALEDARGGDRPPFVTSRTVAIRGSVAEAALRAILSLEEHEARERFQVRGKVMLNPHDPPRPPARRPEEAAADA